jgi:hypothetical protein
LEVQVSEQDASTFTAVYSVNFLNFWTNDRHPTDYPDPSKAHWSRPVLAAHDDEYSMWGTGLPASAGVQSVAEVGSTTDLESELTNAGEPLAMSLLA